MAFLLHHDLETFLNPIALLLPHQLSNVKAFAVSFHFVELTYGRMNYEISIVRDDFIGESNNESVELRIRDLFDADGNVFYHFGLGFLPFELADYLLEQGFSGCIVLVVSCRLVWVGIIFILDWSIIVLVFLLTFVFLDCFRLFG